MNWTGKKKNILRHIRVNYDKPCREIEDKWIEGRKEENLDIIGLKVPMPMYLSSSDSENSCDFSNFKLPSPINKKSRLSSNKKSGRGNNIPLISPDLTMDKDSFPLNNYQILRSKYKKLCEKVNKMEKEIDLVRIKLSILESNFRNCKTKVKSS
ncbi:hypothetical protein CONCODRAFT_6631 [Conidiobolus coronatus NRRL 28638]|uniref:Uncharacterized protein n=1 Tax=Conidiobolus coronatus (strain ATCC 28846 / CBS 209.66 / NRRL 28638) TaxID=796925 RepID=A0A137P6Z2_CONC2|nr:hypothetical protein CONCODRAFT_6631 [Conidiobolus coronatus NRRL 28638]|eukprot:KXN70772.1 hypothetical protein CONCODRAFT_6631 [Conidiobolus coronatus NRRL 28638]